MASSSSHGPDLAVEAPVTTEPAEGVPRKKLKVDWVAEISAQNKAIVASASSVVASLEKQVMVCAGKDKETKVSLGIPSKAPATTLVPSENAVLVSVAQRLFKAAYPDGSEAAHDHHALRSEARKIVHEQVASEKYVRDAASGMGLELMGNWIGAPRSKIDKQITACAGCELSVSWPRCRLCLPWRDGAVGFCGDCESSGKTLFGGTSREVMLEPNNRTKLQKRVGKVRVIRFRKFLTADAPLCDCGSLNRLVKFAAPLKRVVGKSPGQLVYKQQ